jgi:septum formation protein
MDQERIVCPAMTAVEKKKPSLILASESPRRRRLLKEAGFKFRVLPSRIKETHSKRLSPSRIVRTLAIKKALKISRQHPHDYVIGSDTIVFINRHVVGKPRHARHAESILRELSGAWQKVYTGVALVWDGGKSIKSGVAVSSVKMRALNFADIKRASRTHLDKAGAYAVQETKDPFVEKIRGDYDNVVGFPMRIVRRLLRFSGEAIFKAG